MAPVLLQSQVAQAAPGPSMQVASSCSSLPTYQSRGAWLQPVQMVQARVGTAGVRTAAGSIRDYTGPPRRSGAFEPPARQQAVGKQSGMPTLPAAAAHPVPAQQQPSRGSGCFAPPRSTIELQPRSPETEQDREAKAKAKAPEPPGRGADASQDSAGCGAGLSAPTRGLGLGGVALNRLTPASPLPVSRAQLQQPAQPESLLAPNLLPSTAMPDLRAGASQSTQNGTLEEVSETEPDRAKEPSESDGGLINETEIQSSAKASRPPAPCGSPGQSPCTTPGNPMLMTIRSGVFLAAPQHQFADLVAQHPHIRTLAEGEAQTAWPAAKLMSQREAGPQPVLRSNSPHQSPGPSPGPTPRPAQLQQILADPRRVIRQISKTSSDAKLPIHTTQSSPGLSRSMQSRCSEGANSALSAMSIRVGMSASMRVPPGRMPESPNIVSLRSPWMRRRDGGSSAGSDTAGSLTLHAGSLNLAPGRSPVRHAPDNYALAKTLKGWLKEHEERDGPRLPHSSALLNRRAPPQVNIPDWTRQRRSGSDASRRRQCSPLSGTSEVPRMLPGQQHQQYQQQALPRKPPQPDRPEGAMLVEPHSSEQVELMGVTSKAAQGTPQVPRNDGATGQLFHWPGRPSTVRGR